MYKIFGCINIIPFKRFVFTLLLVFFKKLYNNELQSILLVKIKNIKNTIKYNII